MTLDESADVASRARSNDGLPDVVRSAYSASAFFSRLSLYVGKRLDLDVERYWTLRDWWKEARGSKAKTLRALTLAHETEIESVLGELREWRAPRSPFGENSRSTEIYDALAATYDEHAKYVRVGHALAGPCDARHPGFTLSYASKKRLLELRENPSPLAFAPLRLAVSLCLDDPAETVRFEDRAFAELDECDAWELFALRALLTLLHERVDPCVRELERELARPAWEHVLDNLGSGEIPTESREWTFGLAPVYGHGHDAFTLVAFARTVSGPRTGRWRKTGLDVLLAEVALPLEREIARLALHTVRAGRVRVEPTFTLGTPHAYELLCLLARHPRVRVSPRRRVDPDDDPPASILAGPLSMSFERARGGVLVPRFFVENKPLGVPLASLDGDTSSLFRSSVTDDGIVALEVPPSLRPWLDAAIRLGEALSFPTEAAPKLTSATQALVAEGFVTLPREMIGDELPYEPRAALRVEWRSSKEGTSAVLDVMIQVHSAAPFVAAGSGPKLFTFERDGKRVFVERQMDRELRIAGDVVDAIDVPLAWSSGVGHADGIEETLALATWLARNPLHLPMEVKVGQAPVIRPVKKKAGTVVVRRLGAWLRLDGALQIEESHLTIGQLLEAARNAQRYVRAEGNVFVELSDAVLERLRPIALAARLAAPEVTVSNEGTGGPVGNADDVFVHEGFGALLARMNDVFASVEGSGIDLDELARRFEDRERHVELPELERGRLRAYQRTGAEWMLRLASWAPGCVLADDMGLGKTVQTAIALKARAKLGPSLVIAPASVSSNWVSELGRFMPSLSVHEYGARGEVAWQELGCGDVVVVSFGALSRRPSTFGARRWATVVVDEAQYVKNVAAQRRAAVRGLPRDFTIALTGTPLENHLGELFSIVDVVFPGLLGDEATFRAYFRRPIEGHRDQDRLASLALLLRPFLLRRTRASVLTELPPREELTEYVELGPAERKRYLSLRRVVKDSVENRRRVHTPARLRIALLAALTKLRQMACDVRLVEPEFDGGATKMARAVEIVQELASEGNRALVFSQFTRLLKLARAAFEQAGLRVAYLSGATPSGRRKAIVDGFQAGDYDVFCVSLRAGGTGLNLTRASYVIHLDPWWNPAVEEQATSRAHRLGQEQPVTMYRLVARGTIEEAVLEMHDEKRALASAILDGKATPSSVTSEELLELLSFGE